MGVWLKSNVPFNCVCAVFLCLNIEGRSRLSVISACSRRQSQFVIGNLVSVEHSPIIRWSFKVLVDLSFALLFCMPGRAS